MPRVNKKVKQIPDIILDYLDFCNYKNLSLKTTKSYHQTLMLFESYLREEKNITDIRKVDKNIVEEYITFTKERGKYSYITSNDAILKAHQDSRSDIGTEISEATLNNYLRNIKVFFTYLEENSIISENKVKQCKFIKAPRKSKEQLTYYEYQKLIKSLDITKFHEYRDYIITNLIFDTGMRLGETLSREFTADRLNEKWLTDVIEFKLTSGKKAYLSAILDLGDNSIVSYVLGSSNNNRLVFDTLDQSIDANPHARPLFHSDRGFQYTNRIFKGKLDRNNATQSMSRVSRCIDNRPIEGFRSTLKSEMYYLRKFDTYGELEQAIDKYIDFYNTQRLQKKLKSMTPIEYRSHTLTA